MSRARRSAAIAGIVILAVPVTIVLTIMLLPVWSAIERHWGIESVGHSGPAVWCFWVVFGCVIAISLGGWFVVAGRSDSGRAQGEAPQ
jgi:hypothetical protein